MKYKKLHELRDFFSSFKPRNEYYARRFPVVLALDNKHKRFKLITSNPDLISAYTYKDEVDSNNITTVFFEDQLGQRDENRVLVSIFLMDLSK